MTAATLDGPAMRQAQPNNLYAFLADVLARQGLPTIIALGMGWILYSTGGEIVKSHLGFIETTRQVMGSQQQLLEQLRGNQTTLIEMQQKVVDQLSETSRTNGQILELLRERMP